MQALRYSINVTLDGCVHHEAGVAPDEDLEHDVAVAMDCKSRKGRDNEVSKILSVGLSQYHPLTIATKGQAIDQKIQVSGGSKEAVPALPDQDLLAIVRAGDESKVVKKMQLCSGLEAPVRAAHRDRRGGRHVDDGGCPNGSARFRAG